jgi:hypothetical protein
MEKFEVESFRRQQFIDSVSYANTLTEMDGGKAQYESALSDPENNADGRLISTKMLASYELWIFQLKFTAGAPLDELARSLDHIIQAYERCVQELKKSSNTYGEAVFNLDQSMDDYVDYLNLLSAIVLLRRADLLKRAADLLADTSVSQQDTVIEDLLKFFLPGRPLPSEGFWGEPYQLLIDAIEADSSSESAKLMKKYVKKWYPSMKGQASFWGKHEHITPEYSSYQGYWAMCAAAFTYLYELDDSSYRDEIVYPRDLIDYARSLPSDTEAQISQIRQLRVTGGHPCTRSGYWMTPASSDSRSAFQIGDIMPVVANSSYGTTIWQWVDEQ